MRAWKYRGTFPGLSISPRAHADVAGKFTYGTDCAVGDNAIVYGTEGSVISFGDQVYVGRHVELGTTSALTIGDNTSLQDRTLVVGTVSIGRYCLVSLNVLMSSGRHHYESDPPVYIRDQDAAVLGLPDPAPFHDRPIVVDDDCWLGVNAVVLPGVHIGKGCVVGASSVVSDDLPPYTVAVGSPARIIKQRLDFKPPNQIRFDQAADWPYFYSGVGLAKHERRRGTFDGGLLVADRFSLALDARPGVGLMLEVCSPQGALSLTHGTQTAMIGTSYAPVRFSAEPDVLGHLAFDVEPSFTRWPVRLRFAGLE